MRGSEPGRSYARAQKATSSGVYAARRAHGSSSRGSNAVASGGKPFRTLYSVALTTRAVRTYVEIDVGRRNHPSRSRYAQHASDMAHRPPHDDAQVGSNASAPANAYVVGGHPSIFPITTESARSTLASSAARFPPGLVPRPGELADQRELARELVSPGGAAPMP
jgi:hypothetical protein